MIRFGIGALWQYQGLSWAYIILVSLVVAFGALVSFWILMDHFEFRSRGYQIRWLAGDNWIYEERIANGPVECLPFSRKTVGDGYPAACDVYIQSEKNWEQLAPRWARGRRTQIMERIAECSGSDIGGHVRFIDLI